MITRIETLVRSNKCAHDQKWYGHLVFCVLVEHTLSSVFIVGDTEPALIVGNVRSQTRKLLAVFHRLAPSVHHVEAVRLSP